MDSVPAMYAASVVELRIAVIGLLASFSALGGGCAGESPLDGWVPSADFATPDLATPDLSTLDLVTADLASPDLATLDPSNPDLAPSDLAVPDLAIDTPLPDLLGGDLLMVDLQPSEPCSTLAWTWTLPVPQGNTLFSVWAASPSDLWAVGEGGALLRGDGAKWSLQTCGTSRFVKVWGTSATDVWLVANDRVLHWDGQRFAVVPLPPGVYCDVWSSAPDNVWIAAATNQWGPGMLFHFDGTRWLTWAMAHSVTSVRGRASNDVWAITMEGSFFGLESTLFHFDGTRWVEVAGPSLSTLGRLSAAGGTLWTAGTAILGNSKIEYRWDGTAWTAVDTFASQGLTAIAGSSPNDLWAVGMDGIASHFDGQAWKAVGARTTPLYDVLEVGNQDDWAVGVGGSIRHFDGTWSADNASLGSAKDAWVAPSGVVYVAAGLLDRKSPGSEVGQVLKWDGIKWSATHTSAMAGSFAGVGGSGDSDVWAVGYGGVIMHFDGSAWSAQPSGTTVYLSSVSAISASDAWAVGDGVSLHFDGTRWSIVPLPMPALLTRVLALSPTEVWAVGTGGLILRWDGRAWIVVPSGTTDHIGDIGGVHGNLWAASMGGALHFDGNKWSKVASAPGAAQTVLVRSATDIWFGAATVLHGDGTRWTNEPTGIASPAWVMRIVSTRAGVMIIGGGGALIRL